MMSTVPLRLVVFLIAGIACPLAESLSAPETAAGDVFAKENVLAVMHKVNDYQLQHPMTDPRIESGYEWSRATYYTGVMAFYRATKDAKLLDQAIRWAEAKKWQPGPEVPGVNKLTCTQTYLDLYLIKHDPRMIAPTVEWVNSGVPNSPTGTKDWYYSWGRAIPDSLYVAAPTLAMLTEATGDEKYLRCMDAFFWGTYDLLFDKEAGFFYETKEFIERRNPSDRKIFWSRGNGWAIASVPRILEHLPKEHPARPRYVDVLRVMSSAAVKAQGGDGLWRANLADFDEFPNKESSGSGFFCYALAWGINHGVLDRPMYLPAVRNAWSGLVGCVSPEGKVEWGQDVGDRPTSVRKDDSHEYVSGTFLLAGSEVLKLVP